MSNQYLKYIRNISLFYNYDILNSVKYTMSSHNNTVDSHYLDLTYLE